MEQNFNVPTQENNRGLPISIFLISILGIGIGLLAFWFFSKPTTDTSIPISIESPTITPTSEILRPVTNTISTTTPTPRPTGPGQYACSIGGDCKIWNPKIQKENCTTTFADDKCMDKCSDISIRCKI